MLPAARKSVFSDKLFRGVWSPPSVPKTSKAQKMNEMINKSSFWVLLKLLAAVVLLTWLKKLRAVVVLARLRKSPESGTDDGIKAAEDASVATSFFFRRSLVTAEQCGQQENVTPLMKRLKIKTDRNDEDIVHLSHETLPVTTSPGISSWDLFDWVKMLRSCI